MVNAGASHIGSVEVGGAVADGAFSLLGSALEAWGKYQPQGFTLSEDMLQRLLPDIVRSFSLSGHNDTFETSCMLAELFVPPGGDDEQPLFQKMLKARKGKVQFLYFWRAFSQVARLLAQLRALKRKNDPGERLAEELETLRDAVLRTLETQDQTGDEQLSLAVADLAEAVAVAAKMSITPGFWRDMEQTLRKPKKAKRARRAKRADRLTVDELTTMLLSWLKDAAVWQPKDEDASAEAEQQSELACLKTSVAKDSRLPVFLHVYHVGDDEGVRKLNRRLAARTSPIKLGGIFHAGIEVNGLEWSFGMSPSECVPGVACNEPKSHEMHTYRQSIRLKSTKLSAEEIADLLAEMIEEYPGNDYHLLRRNCCHFADDFARRLGAGRLPGWVYRLARVGALVDGAMQCVGGSGLCPDSESDRDDW